ncbi:hypothetical protein [Pseudoalteromonas sp.]|uniref:hypothetical protein n=1 Tax=Pseudoalteromonas sp. TaxID=53249 RepID=UPI003D112485
MSESKFYELFSSNLMFEEQRNGDVQISDSEFIFCTVDDVLAQDDGKALDRAKYIVRAVNMHHEMYKFLDNLANGSGTDYPIEQLLAKARGEL